MKSVKVLAAVATASLLSGCIVVATPSHADTHQRKQLTLDASSLSELDIDAGAGSLEVRGQSGLSEIRVTADIYTDSKYRDHYELSLTEAGDTANLVAKNKSTSGFWVGSSPRIDLVVHVPDEMTLDIDDGSGDMRVTGISASVNISDGSGDIEVEQLHGDLKIDDGSGEMELSDIRGNLTIDDGSGNIYAKNITGSAVFEDGSGDLTVKKVSGNVTVDDGSGDISVQDAGGLTILETGSGGLSVKGVEGNFEIDS